MRDKLRRRYQVHKEVTRNGYFEGEIALSELTRLRELLPLETPGCEGRAVTVRFEFVRSEYDISMITGRLETSLELECQRCLKALDVPMKLDFNLMVDPGDELLHKNGVDSLYSEDGHIDIFDLVEDELILAIPLVAMHEDTACNEHWQATANEPAVADRENPFSVLQQLKTTDQS